VKELEKSVGISGRKLSRKESIFPER